MFANGGEGPFVSGLSFHERDGPLLAIAGLCGGAGASALAYLTAATAARESSAPVLVADTGGPTAGLSNHAGVSSPLTLADIAQRIAETGLAGRVVCAEGEHRLRILASAPQFTVDAEDDAIVTVLSDARQAHGLCVIDTGILARPAEQAALKTATHVAWITIANGDSVKRARRVLGRIAPLGRPELLVARADPHASKPPLEELAALADDRRAPLILMPSLPDISSVRLSEMIECSGLALQAIGGVLHR